MASWAATVVGLSLLGSASAVALGTGMSMPVGGVQAAASASVIASSSTLTFRSLSNYSLVRIMASFHEEYVFCRLRVPRSDSNSPSSIYYASKDVGSATCANVSMIALHA